MANRDCQDEGHTWDQIPGSACLCTSCGAVLEICMTCFGSGCDECHDNGAILHEPEEDS